MENKIIAEEKDGNTCCWNASDEVRIVGNAMIFTQKETGDRVILPLSSYRLILCEKVNLCELTWQKPM